MVNKSAQATNQLRMIAEAQASMSSNKYTKRPGLCAQHIRKILWASVPEKYRPPVIRTAWLQFLWFKARGYSVPVESGSVPGDILYKKPTITNPAGHVGIRVPGNFVAENSTYHYKRTRDARGYRNVTEFGRIDGIVRLPPH